MHTENQTILIKTKNYKIKVIINIKYSLMYLTVPPHYFIKQVNTSEDICNVNILLLSKSNIGITTVSIVI
jgi:hypothetical protein